MKVKGGYNVHLEGRPREAVEALAEPTVLHLPLRSQRFTFSQVGVKDGERVSFGQVLAMDPACHSVPLLAPYGGTVRIEGTSNHITLEALVPRAKQAFNPEKNAGHFPHETDVAKELRRRLLALGAWQFFSDAHTEAVPDPFSDPQAVIVSTLSLEPFTARGDVQMKENLSRFLAGLERLQSLLEYQPIYLVLPDIHSAFAAHVRQALRGFAWLTAVDIPLRYGLGHSAVLARALGLKRRQDHPVWALRVEGVLAVDTALTHSQPCTDRIVSVGGPAAASPVHVRTMVGYPLRDILDSQAAVPDVRVINGGVLSGVEIGPDQLGLDAECTGLTVLPLPAEREFLSFLRPGWDRRSYSRCFLSALRRPFPEPLTAGRRGELRACISCRFCEEVCPARIMPHLIHKYLYQEKLEEAQVAGVELCVACGLCSFVCPSKIELCRQFVDAQVLIRQELHGEGVKA